MSQHPQELQLPWDDLDSKERLLPNLEQVLENRETQWQTVTLNRRQWRSGTRLWIRDPFGKFPSQALLCTKQAYSPTHILEWFVRRWLLEVTFEEVRAHLGMDSQRQWSDFAIARTTPILLGLFSLVTILTDQIHKLTFLGKFAKLLGTPNRYLPFQMHSLWYVDFYGLVLFQSHLNQLR